MNKGVEALIKARKELNLTQEELADKVGIKRSTIACIESGINTPSIPTAKLLANELKFNWTLFYEEV